MVKFPAQLFLALGSGWYRRWNRLRYYLVVPWRADLHASDARNERYGYGDLDQAQWMSLMGHVIYGITTGLSFVSLCKRLV